jgi:hypothetical protein
MRRLTILCALAALALVLVLVLVGCSKGKTGSPCAKPADCKYGYFCAIDGKCQAGPETACGYIARCIPKLESGQAEMLFGMPNTGFRRLLRDSPNEGMCESKLKVIASMNRTVAMSRACGPRVTKAP